MACHISPIAKNGLLGLPIALQLKCLLYLDMIDLLRFFDALETPGTSALLCTLIKASKALWSSNFQSPNEEGPYQFQSLRPSSHEPRNHDGEYQLHHAPRFAEGMSFSTFSRFLGGEDFMQEVVRQVTPSADQIFHRHSCPWVQRPPSFPICAASWIRVLNLSGFLRNRPVQLQANEIGTHTLLHFFPRLHCLVNLERLSIAGPLGLSRDREWGIGKDTGLGGSYRHLPWQFMYLFNTLLTSLPRLRELKFSGLLSMYDELEVVRWIHQSDFFKAPHPPLMLSDIRCRLPIDEEIYLFDQEPDNLQLIRECDAAGCGRCVTILSGENLCNNCFRRFCEYHSTGAHALLFVCHRGCFSHCTLCEPKVPILHTIIHPRGWGVI